MDDRMDVKKLQSLAQFCERAEKLPLLLHVGEKPWRNVAEIRLLFRSPLEFAVM
jgi:hypothetical protein